MADATTGLRSAARRAVLFAPERLADGLLRSLLTPPDQPAFDFGLPFGEPALVPANSVSWRVFKNPVALFVGGVAAVILELAEPRVRTGVWEHSAFRSDPVRRLQRTGLAAMVTVYGARSRAEAMIAGVTALHAKIGGTTPAGEPYRATDVGLLRWVHATACFGFATAYSRFVRRLGEPDFDRFYAEALPAARLYGAEGAPGSQAEVAGLFAAMRDRLEPSPIIDEFLAIMREAPVLPAPLRPVQRMLVRAGVETVPGWVRDRLGLGPAEGLRPWEAAMIRQAGRLADRIAPPSSPAVRSCRRLGLPPDYLFRSG